MFGRYAASVKPVIERYLRLGLELDRHVEGAVDAYYGPPELAAEIAARPPTEPRLLVAEADALLEEVDDGWLRDQLVGVRTYARMLAGDADSYSDEVEGCYGVRPAFTDEAVFEAAHAELESLLPGDGSLAERYHNWRESTRIPAERVEETIAALIEEARAWTRRVVGLPDGESVELEIVRDKPWWAFCYYLGDLRSRIAVNVDLPISAIEVLHLAAHETYPGHHTERCLKEETLVRGCGLLEETIVLTPAPQSLVAEGIAETAPTMLLAGDGRDALMDVLKDSGVELDLDHTLAVRRAHDPCDWAEVNGSLLLHEHGASEDDVKSYLARWSLRTPEQADHLLRFFRAPTSRTYVINYPAGRELCAAYVDGRPDRFRHLLSEQVRVRELVEAREAAGAGA
jgi:hypothetical protein